MRPRNLTIDIHRLKMNSSKTELGSGHDRTFFDLDSPLPIPKSVRPPLPINIASDLRAACAHVVENNKPSHENWVNSSSRPFRELPATSSGTDTGLFGVSTSSSRNYRPRSSTREQPRTDEAARLQAQRNNARSLRAEQLMNSAQAQAQRASRHARPPLSLSLSSMQFIQSSTREGSERGRSSSRSNAADTLRSTPQTDSTEFTWTSSTDLTSSIITPARSSYRVSCQAVPSAPESGKSSKVDAVNSESLRRALEKHQMSQESRNAANSASSPAFYASATEQEHVIRAVPRKPVATRRASTEPFQPLSKRTVPETGNDRGRSRNDSRLSGSRKPDQPEMRGRQVARPDTRTERASRAASRVASRAASRARSVTREIGALFHRRPSIDPASTSREQARSPSRPRKLNRKERFGHTAAPPHGDSDALRGRSMSLESFYSTFSHIASSVTSRHPQSSGHNRNHSHRGAPISPATSKPTIDLNRELPPLPSLDQWDQSQQASGYDISTQPEEPMAYRLDFPFESPTLDLGYGQERSPTLGEVAPDLDSALEQGGAPVKRRTRNFSIPGRPIVVEDNGSRTELPHSGRPSYNHHRMHSNYTSREPVASMEEWNRFEFNDPHGIPGDDLRPLPASRVKEKHKWKWWIGKERRAAPDLIATR